MRTYPPPYVRGVPSFLEPVVPPPSPGEIEAADGIRAQFLLPGDDPPYMVDVVRAFRLIEGRRTYVEVGTYDKGCLAYVATLLAPDAVMIDVDIEAREDQTARLGRYLQPRQTLVTLVGDSTSPEIVGKVKELLGERGAEAVFIDSNHTAPYVWADWTAYQQVLAKNGLMFFHDIFWRGSEECFGVAQAMEWIDRVMPVYAVHADHPVHRYFPHFDKTEAVWGGVGILKPA